MKSRAPRASSALALAVIAASVQWGGCMTRPTEAGRPTTKMNYTGNPGAVAVEKVDLLFSIDNSASMGDKQDYLKQAIPDLIKRLLTPNCVDSVDKKTIVGVSHDDGTCDKGKVEFPPVHDLHIGIVSSSLGPRLGNACKPTTLADGRDAHKDDQAHLLTRAGSDEHASPDAQASGFLAWCPSSDANAGKQPSAGSTPVKDVKALEHDFQDIVAGVSQFGCGIESQLENWYRFLVQPDPYDHLELQNDRASWVGVDQTILRQRHDFLRPDSLVAVIVLTDENDSEIDVRSYGGEGYLWMSTDYAPARGTSACDANPGDPRCMSCRQAPNGGAGDPSCDKGPYKDKTDWGFDLNLRHVHMKQKYGIEPQFPITRYVKGLSSKRVPDRNGEYPAGAANYVGNDGCTNPLFAASLPDGSNTSPRALCDLPPGGRDKGLVFYAHIGGVPNELLHFVPNDAQASTLSDDDWVKILGKDPVRFDYRGIDPHMIESYSPRPGLAPPASADDADPVHGREWVTDQGPHLDLNVDRQYACTFPLAAPRNCTDPANKDACDCSSSALSHEQTPPVCDATHPTVQVRAKAYPTVRELHLAKLMGTQGIVSSICPIHVAELAPADPLYGYRPAVTTIVDRLKDALTNQCVPRKLKVDDDGTVPCLVLVTLPTPGGEEACLAKLGLREPEPSVLERFRASARDEWLAAGGPKSGGPDPFTLPVCQLSQLPPADLVNGSCAESTKPGWCYVSGGAAGKCQQAVLFSPGSPPKSAKVTLQCIEPSDVASPPK